MGSSPSFARRAAAIVYTSKAVRFVVVCLLLILLLVRSVALLSVLNAPLTLIRDPSVAACASSGRGWLSVTHLRARRAVSYGPECWCACMQRILPETGRSIAAGGIVGGLVNVLLVSLAAAAVVVLVRIAVKLFLAYRIKAHGPLKAAPTDALPLPSERA